MCFQAKHLQNSCFQGGTGVKALWCVGARCGRLLLNDAFNLCQPQLSQRSLALIGTSRVAIAVLEALC